MGILHCPFALQVTVAVPGLGELQVTVPDGVSGQEMLQLVQQAAEEAAAEQEQRRSKRQRR